MGKYDLTEFRKVAEYLTAVGIEYELDICNDGWQIGVPHLPRHGQWEFDVIINRMSYGHAQGLLEVMGCISDYEEDVEGYLTALEVIERIERNYRNKENK